MPEAVCLNCGKELDARAAGWRSEYCSVECRKVGRRRARNQRYYLKRRKGRKNGEVFHVKQLHIQEQG